MGHRWSAHLVFTRLLVICLVVVAAALAAVAGGVAARQPADTQRLTVRRVSRSAFERGPVTAPTLPTTTTSTSTTSPPVADPPTTAPTTTTAPIPASRRVFVVGDSLTQGVEEALPNTLRDVGWMATGIDAERGRHTVTGLDVLKQHRADLPATVLVALGTNDLSASPSDIDAWVHQARMLVGKRRLIWVNLNLLDIPRFSNYHALNDALAAAAAKYHVELADWDKWSTANNIEHLGDGIHYSLEAYHQRAEFYGKVIPRK